MSRMKGIVPLLLLLASGSGCQTFKEVYDYFTGNTALNAVSKMEDQYFPDERRQGINRLADRDYGRRMPYTERYIQIAQNDPDWLVRATAIRALNRSRDVEAGPVFVKALSDPNPLVRQEAAKALANVPDEKAVPVLLKLVDNPQEPRDVRIAAADALKHFRSLEVARGLVTTLNARDFGVAWQARKSLIELTGNDLEYNEAAWLQYLTGPDRPFG
jgi:hypothetical protein